MWRKFISEASNDDEESFVNIGIIIKKYLNNPRAHGDIPNLSSLGECSPFLAVFKVGAIFFSKLSKIVSKKLR